MNVGIRPATAADVEACGRIIYEAFEGIAEQHRFPPDFPTVEAGTQLSSLFINHPAIFGVVADRYGRTRALMGSVLIYSIFTAACGLATTVAQLAVFRILLGIGMGGEWASGAALVSETWPAEHRGKALGLMQSAWAICSWSSCAHCPATTTVRRPASS